MNNHTLTFLFAFLLLLSGGPSLWAQCNPDNTPPTLTCVDRTLSLTIDGTGSFFFGPSDFNDACDGFNLNIQYQINNEPILSSSSVSVDCAHIGVNDLKIWVSDQSGNIDSCTSTFVVEDNLAPVAICEIDVDLTLSASGTAFLVPGMVDDGSYDNCNNLTLKIALLNGSFEDSLFFDCNSSPIQLIRLGLFDASNTLSNVCWTNLRISDPLMSCQSCNPDLTPPLLNCPQQSITLGQSGTTSLSLDPFGIQDQCDGQNVTISYQINTEPIVTGATSIDLDCSHVGDNAIQVWATDQSGNTDSCATIISVQGNGSPITITCNNNVNVSLSATGTATIWPNMILEGPPISCGNFSYKIALVNGIFEDSLIVNCSTNPSTDVQIGLFDSNNTMINVCWSTLQISDMLMVCQECNPDVTPPMLDCTDYTVSLGANGTASVFLSSLNIQDRCDGSNINMDYQINTEAIVTSATSIDVDCAYLGANTVKVWATDQSGNIDSCTFTMTVRNNLGPILVCASQLTFDLPASGTLTITPEMVLETWVSVCDTPTFKIALPNGPLLDSVVVDCAYLDLLLVVVTAIDSTNGNFATCASSIDLNDPLGLCQSLDISGTVFADTSLNCIRDMGEVGLPINTEVLFTNLQNGDTHTLTTNADGDYQFTTAYNSANPTPSYEVSLPNIPSDLLHCGQTQTLVISNGSSSASLDFPVKIFQSCPYQTVDISTSRVRACRNSRYVISYCNYSALTINNAYVTVMLDPLFELVNSEIPWSSVSGNTYTFDLGNLNPVDCGQFYVDAKADCSVQASQTLCATANIYPAVLCQQSPPNWSGAQIVAEGACQGDSLSFKLENIGTGNMAQVQQYLIVEDLVMYMNNPYQLEIGQSLEVKVPANGSTWRMEAIQEPGYPGDSQPIAWSEGCGGINNTGLINLFPVNNSDPFQSTFCLEAVNSYDPNDKQGFPRGYDAEHYIKANQSLDYLIRFQNTGTDTAYQVTIVDTLDSQLYFPSLRPGSSSHPYRFEISEDGVAKFIFDNILLPDSMANEAASNGFVKFKIAQKTDLLPGSVLENSAAIYFDNNAPVITNKTWHTIEYPPVATSLNPKPSLTKAIKTNPNPFRHLVQFQIEGADLDQGMLIVYDLVGKTLHSQSFSGTQVEFRRNGLPAGMYLYEIKDGQQLIGNGKIIVD